MESLSSRNNGEIKGFPDKKKLKLKDFITTKLVFQETLNRLLQVENTNDIYHKTRTNNPKMYTEPQRMLSSHSNLEKE